MYVDRSEASVPHLLFIDYTQVAQGGTDVSPFSPYNSSGKSGKQRERDWSKTIQGGLEI